MRQQAALTLSAGQLYDDIGRRATRPMMPTSERWV